MTRRLFFVVDALSVSAIGLFFYLAARRFAFPGNADDKTISLVQLFTTLPMAFGILWVIYRLLWGKKNFPRQLEKLLIIENTQGGNTRRIVIPLAIAAVVIFLLKLFAFLIKVM